MPTEPEPVTEKLEENPFDKVKIDIEVSEEEKIGQEFIEKEETAMEEVTAEKKEPSRVAKLKKALCSITAGLILMGAVSSYAQEYPQAEKEKRETIVETAPEMSLEQQNKLALQVLEKFTECKDVEQSRYRRKIVAKARAQRLVGCLAQQLKKGKIEPGVLIPPQDMKDAIDLLNQNISTFADQKFGDADGIPSPEEMAKFRDEVKNNLALQELQKMMTQY